MSESQPRTPEPDPHWIQFGSSLHRTGPGLESVWIQFESNLNQIGSRNSILGGIKFGSILVKTRSHNIAHMFFIPNFVCVTFILCTKCVTTCCIKFGSIVWCNLNTWCVYSLCKCLSLRLFLCESALKVHIQFVCAPRVDAMPPQQHRGGAQQRLARARAKAAADEVQSQLAIYLVAP